MVVLPVSANEASALVPEAGVHEIVDETGFKLILAKQDA